MSGRGTNEAKARLEVVLGEKTLTIEELSAIGEGTVVELDRLADDPVDVSVAGEVVAKAEVVVIDDRLGIRVLKLLEREDAR